MSKVSRRVRLLRIAQHTYLDDQQQAYKPSRTEKNYNTRPSDDYRQQELTKYQPPAETDYQKWTRSPQPWLPTHYGKPGPEWGTPERLKLQKEEEAKRQKVNLNFPDVSEEHIRYKGLTDQQRANMHQDDEQNYRRHTTNPFRSKEPFVPEHQRYYDLDKALPEDAKKEVLAAYNALKTSAAAFKARYEQANEMASIDNNMDYSGSYIDIYKRLPDFTVRAVRRGIGALFGSTQNLPGYRTNTEVSELIKYLNTGIKIFNMTAVNFDKKIGEMREAKRRMDLICTAYDKRVKLLEKLPDIVAKSTTEYLRKKNVREFLKWMDQYFPSEKEGFFGPAIKQILSQSPSNSYFSIGSLNSFKTYSEIYSKSVMGLKSNIIFEMARKVHRTFTDELSEMVLQDVNKKAGAIVMLLPDPSYSSPGKSSISPEQMMTLQKYLTSEIKINIRGIIQTIGNLHKTKDEETRKAEMISTTENFITDLRGFLVDTHVRAVDDIVKDFMRDFDMKHPELLQEKKVLKLSDFPPSTVQDLANKFIRNLITRSFADMRPNEYNARDLIGLGKIIRETGKYSPQEIADHLSEKLAAVPKEFWTHLVRTAFRKIGDKPTTEGRLLGYDVMDAKNILLSIHSAMTGYSPRFVVAAIIGVMQKTGKMNPDTFTNVFAKNFQRINGVFQNIQNNLGEELKPQDIIDTIVGTVGTIDNIEKGFNSFLDFSKVIHDTAKGLKGKEILAVFRNPNYGQTTAIAKKLLSTYAMLKSKGGVDGIIKKYGPILETMKNEGMISKNFEANIRFITSLFSSGKLLTPASPNFQKAFQAMASIETDLYAVEMSKELTQLTKNYQPKDKRLFNLNLSISPTLRFRVLQDKDPRTLRIGIETDCCQRIGGVGENAAQDSFINPTAGVVILEQEVAGDWKLLAQSYFHYVVNDNGFILDNVETNRANVQASGVDLEAAYAYLAQQIKEKFNVGYFLAGKDYSKIKTNSFQKNKLPGGDPRFFDPKAGKYTDFSASDNMNLLEPKFDPSEAIAKMTGQLAAAKEAFGRHLDRILKWSISGIST